MNYFVCRYVHPIKLLHFGIGEKFSSMGFFLYIYFFDNMNIRSFTSTDPMGRCSLCVPHARVELVTYIFFSAYNVIFLCIIFFCMLLIDDYFLWVDGDGEFKFRLVDWNVVCF